MPAIFHWDGCSHLQMANNCGEIFFRHYIKPNIFNFKSDGCLGTYCLQGGPPICSFPKYSRGPKLRNLFYFLPILGLFWRMFIGPNDIWQLPNLFSLRTYDWQLINYRQHFENTEIRAFVWLRSEPNTPRPKTDLPHQPNLVQQVLFVSTQTFVHECCIC
jgi:hypothetical protein